MLLDKSDQFYRKLAKIPRKDLLELIAAQDQELLEQIHHIENVFRVRLNHLNWDDGTPILNRLFTCEELAYLVDEPFEVNPELTSLGLSISEQERLHYAKDAVLWAKHYLNATPRAYQILMIRHQKRFKILRAGRRLGKTHTLAILLLHYCFTTNDGKCLIVTPMKEQSGLIYEEIIKLAKKSDLVLESIKRKVTSPQYEIDFTNGSMCKFFSSGMKTGAKADITRGQEAHIIVLDELDYMGDDDLDALLAMLQRTDDNQAPKKLIGASTPTGRRATFWEWCHSDRFKEFWFPSYCNPYWEDDQEEFFRDFYTDTGYRHEIEADWGDTEEGVYPKKYLDLAFKNPGWDYVKSPNYTNNSIYILGVDWDKYGAGVNLVILEKMPPNHPNPELANKVKLYYREEMPKDEYAFLKAVDYIIQLDQLFKFKHIYVDSGSGETQWEMLRKYGVEHPQIGLTEKVKRISFAGTVEIRDPYTMQKSKKEMKPFMVDNLKQMFEKSYMMIPDHDQELYMQLISYVVARVTPTGREVFEINARNVADHAHDALILAALAVTENYGDLMHTNYATKSYAISSDVFLQTLELSNDPGQRAAEEEIIEEKWGSAANAPVQFRRQMAYNRKRNAKISRKMF